MESLQKISVREKQGEEINHDLLDCWFLSAWGASCPERGGDLKKKSESSCKIGYSFIRFGFAQSTIYASPERCLAQTTWPCPPERRWIVFGRTAWTTLPQRRGSPLWSRGGSSSWSPCARFSGAHLQFEREREQTMIEMEST